MELAYHKDMEEGTYLVDVVSRKKHVVPLLMEVFN